ncbi:MAG: response regulator [Fimbriimonas sp.]
MILTNTPDPIVLVVEDNADDEALTLRGLRRSPRPLQIRVARDGEEAIAMLEDGLVPDLVLVDLKMPRIGGIEVLGAIREKPSTKHVPVVVFSSSDETYDIVRCYERGANTYIRKPVEFVPFLDCLELLTKYWFENSKLPLTL